MTSQVGSVGGSSARGRVAAAAVLLACLVAAVYGRTFGYGFIAFDDPEYLLKNPMVSRGLSGEGLLWAFRAVHQANWHPITWLSHMADFSLFGAKAGGHHAVSAAFHAGAAVLLFAALNAMTGQFGRPLFVVAVFAAHPLNVESVAWVSERKSVICALFWMLALLAWTRYARRPTRRGYLEAAACFVLALLAKPAAVTLPAVLLLIDYWPLGRIGSPAAGGRHGPLTAVEALREKLPLFALSLVAGVATVLFQRAGGALQGIDLFPLPARIENAALAVLIYPWKTFVPTALAIWHPHPSSSIPFWQWSGAAVLAGAATVAVARFAPRRPELATGWFWYLAGFAPVSGIVQVGGQAWAERYFYLPGIGLLLMLAWGPWSEWGRRAAAGVRTSLAIAAVVALAGAAWVQAGRWRDSVTLFTHTLAVTDRNVLVHTNLGGVYFADGRFEQALAEYDAALQVQPRNTRVLFNAAVTLARLQRWEESAAAYRRVIELEPRRCDARSALGMQALFRGDRGTAREQHRAMERLCPEEAKRLGPYLGFGGR